MLEKNEIIQSVLRNLRIEELNPMQEASLEQATGKKDVILLSPTGSGKTLAYLLPLLLTLKTDDGSVQVLILVPSRELALQIDSVFKAMGTSSPCFYPCRRCGWVCSHSIVSCIQR